MMHATKLFFLLNYTLIILFIIINGFVCWAGNYSLDLNIPSSLNPVGSGAKALSMGGAFIAVCDDGTAPSWNPAGLFQLEFPEISFVYDYTERKEDSIFYETTNRKGNVYEFKLNYLSFVLPIADQMNIAFSFQNFFNLNHEWNYEHKHISKEYLEPIKIYQRQEGDLNAYGFSLCYDFNPLVIGITVNNWNNSKWDQVNIQKGKFGEPGIMSIEYSDYKTESFTFKGYNFHFGFLWDITKSKSWRIAGILKTPFKAKLNYKFDSFYQEFYDPIDETPLKETHLEGEQDNYIRMPLAYGIGIAHRCMDKQLWISADIYRTHWEDYELEDVENTRRNPINWKNKADSSIDPTTWFRLGVEYKKPNCIINGKPVAIKFRAGIFYDPAPAENSPDNFYGVAIGGGISYEWFVFDLAGHYRYGNNVGESMYEDYIKFSQDVKEYKIYASVVLHIPHNIPCVF